MYFIRDMRRMSGIVIRIDEAVAMVAYKAEDLRRGNNDTSDSIQLIANVSETL